MSNVIYKGILLGVEEVRPFFNLLKENIIRSRIAMTVVFLKVIPKNHSFINLGLDIQEQVDRILLSKVRNTDLLFKLDEPNEWGIILMQSVEKDAIAFLDRIFSRVKEENIPLYSVNQYTLCATIVEIKTNKVNFSDILEEKKQVFQNTLEPWQVELITTYKEPEPQNIKVSIIENNEIFRGILKTTIQKIQTEHFILDIHDFLDGYDFLKSDWYLTSHTHIVIINDILPRKNGLEVLQTLRSLPNQKKFIVYMMTKRNSQTDMIYAYESGVDEYLIKPFDLRLFKAQILRTLERLQS